MTDPKDPKEAVDPRNDVRPVEVLISAALEAPHDDEAPFWAGIWAPHWRGTREVLEQASALCRSPCSVERRLGANILGQLGCPERSFPDESSGILTRLLEVEHETTVLSAALTALSHHRAPEAIGLISRFRHHAETDVRFAVVLALSGYELADAIEPLIELSGDPEAHVRNWATFALGTQVDVDTPGLRDALAARLTDVDDDTRCEALVGLASRGDPRVIPALRQALASESVWTLQVEAAARIGDQQLLPFLLALKRWWDVDERLLEEAIRAWAEGVAGRHGYSVRFLGIGPLDEALGSPTQLGVFQRG